MSTPIPASPEHVCQSDALDQTFWQAPLREFVHQFGFVGGGLLVGSPQQEPQQMVCWADPSERSPLPLLETLVDWKHLAHVELFQVVAIANQRFPTPYYLYGCLCNDTPEAACYLFCWSLTPLTEHQRYGNSLYARTVQSQRMSAQREKAPDVHAILQRTHHQLQTPLALILLYADLLKTAIVDRQPLEWLENLHTVAENMHVSLNHLTDSAAATTSHPDDYDLRQLMMACGQELQPWIEEKQLTVVYSARSLWLRVNGWEMKQALQNVLNNAIAFSPHGGRISCEWQSCQGEVIIKVSDQGAGLSAEDLQCLGVPFYSRRPGGTGLGLAIAKQIILGHQGRLWAENRPDGGAQFCIMLPRDRS